jgi:hypothetical protein
MQIFTVTLVITIMIMATVFVTVRHFRRKEMSDRRSRYAPFVMWFCVLLIAADALVGDDLTMYEYEVLQDVANGTSYEEAQDSYFEEKTKEAAGSATVDTALNLFKKRKK